MREAAHGLQAWPCTVSSYRASLRIPLPGCGKRQAAARSGSSIAFTEVGHSCRIHTHLSSGDVSTSAHFARDAVISGAAESSSSERALENTAESSQQYKEDPTTSSGFTDPADLIDDHWRDLPIDQLRRLGEIGWDIDPDGPTGAEKFDNTFGKRQQGLNSTAIEVIGMGSWRLKPVVSSLIQFLVAHIEGAWRHLIDELGLYPLPPEWKYIDSLDPDGEYGSWSFQDLEPPKRGEAGWPRLQIENRCYQSQVFRKLHLEVAQRQDGLEILHCVMYPWADFDLPILSMDVVAKDGSVSLAIMDPCPVALNRALPPAYIQICQALRQQYGVDNNRAVPDWGKEIFSDHCIMMRPQSPEELSGFIMYAVALTRVHLRVAHNAEPLQHNRASRMQHISAAQRRYSEKQLLNSKTRRVLEAAFSSEFAEEYMAGIMFDTASADEQEEGENGNGTAAKQRGVQQAPSDPGGSKTNGGQHAARTSVGVQQ